MDGFRYSAHREGGFIVLKRIRISSVPMSAVKCNQSDRKERMLIFCDSQRVTSDVICDSHVAVQLLPRLCRHPHLYSLSHQELKYANLEPDPL